MKMKLPMIRRFFAWMDERHSVFLRRGRGQDWPWTKDKILQEYFFTNVFRELDAVTIGLHKRMDVKPVVNYAPHERWYRIVVYRAFNNPFTYDVLHKAGAMGNLTKMLRALRKMEKHGQKIFTGAYVVTNGGSTRPKIEVMSEALIEIFNRRDEVFKRVVASNTLEGAVREMCRMPMHGKFTSYEVACDMRYQSRMLRDATDVMTWANPGPGARRGISRLVSGTIGANVPRDECVEKMRELLALSGEFWQHDGWKLEMREIEHSLCEFDKYERARLGEGRLKRRYRGWK